MKFGTFFSLLVISFGVFICVCVVFGFTFDLHFKLAFYYT